MTPNRYLPCDAVLTGRMRAMDPSWMVPQGVATWADLTEATGQARSAGRTGASSCASAARVID